MTKKPRPSGEATCRPTGRPASLSGSPPRPSGGGWRPAESQHLVQSIKGQGVEGQFAEYLSNTRQATTMQSLVAFSLLVVAALADPQVTPFGYGYTAGVYPGVYGAYPYAGGYVAGSSPFVAKSVYYPTVAVPSQDTSRGLPQPVEDTAEVKAAKANFAAEYYRTAARAAVASPVVTYPYAGAAYVSSPVVGTPVVAVESRRHKREVQTPASTTPLVYARAAPAVVAPYTAAAYPYTASYATPYAAAPYVYGGAYYNTAAYSYPYAGAAAPVTYAY